MTIKGEEIDLLFLPRNGFPGQILEVGDTLSFSGLVGPPLNSKLSIKVTSPSGETREISGQANRIGYFYQPEDDFVVLEPGIWTVDLEVVHDGMTSSGPTMAPYPTGTALGADDGSYKIYVVNSDHSRAHLISQEAGFVSITGEPIAPILFKGILPGEFSGAEYTYTIRMPGVILEQGLGMAEGESFSLLYDPVILNQDFPNLDLTAVDFSGQVWQTRSGSQSSLKRTIVICLFYHFAWRGGILQVNNRQVVWLGLALGILLLVGCQEIATRDTSQEVTYPEKRSSSAITITSDGSTLLVVNPDSNTLSLVDAGTWKCWERFQ